MKQLFHYFINATTKADFLAAVAALPYFSDQEHGFTGEERWSYYHPETVNENDPETGDYSFERQIEIDLKDVTGTIKARDENGEFIVTETDEDGNPTAYQLAEGYHSNIVSNVALTFPEGMTVTPDPPQSKFA